jgi:hypothetical protein
VAPAPRGLEEQPRLAGEHACGLGEVPREVAQLEEAHPDVDGVQPLPRRGRAREAGDEHLAAQREHALHQAHPRGRHRAVQPHEEPDVLQGDGVPPVVHAGLSATVEADEPARGEALQRLAHRAAAHPEHGRQETLRWQAPRRPEPVRDEHALELHLDLFDRRPMLQLPHVVPSEGRRAEVQAAGHTRGRREGTRARDAPNPDREGAWR